jgi:hypothetical protein
MVVWCERNWGEVGGDEAPDMAGLAVPISTRVVNDLLVSLCGERTRG